MPITTCSARGERFLPDVLQGLEAAIRNRVGRRLRDLQILLRDNCVVLRGRAPSYYVKQLAQQAVLGLNRLPIMANEIEVTTVVASARDEAADPVTACDP